MVELLPLNYKDIYEIYLSRRGITNLTDEFFEQISHVTKLDLSFNQLESIPDSISKLTNLQDLNLESNQFRFLPESIGSLTNLKNLNLSFNNLTFLPESIGSLTNLHTLNLSFNKNLTSCFYQSINHRKFY